MNKKNTRQKNMKSKLIAAVAMLLVSCIMMVSSTYAWFTLSTAPEVQGITTTVGANGNLEIALLPTNGNVNDITSGIGDATLDWVSKNGTWGNLLDLSDPSYGLGEITLLPSRLNISATEDVTKLPTLSGSPLLVPTYGADGRIEGLSANGVGFGAKNPNANVDGFILNTGTDDDLWGIRAVGTSSTQSETALNFQNALAAISNNRGAANSQINTALATYGDTLATIALKYANGDIDGFDAYMGDINAMLTELEGASDKIEVALYNALLALSISNIPVDAGADGEFGNEDDTKISSITVDLNGAQTKMYDAVKFNLENGISLTTTWGWLGSYASVLEAAFPALYSAYNGWNDINTNVTAARNAFEAINTEDGGVDVNEIKSVVGYLMNPDYVTINGIAIDDVKENMGLLFAGGASGINLQLNTGSGIFAYYGQLTGNVSGSVTLPNPTYVQGQNLGGATIMLMTTTEPAAGPLLTQVRSAIALIGVTSDDASGTASVIDVTYAYALDFVFRTNAANSSLLLQSDAAQRIYGDSQNAATMGAGSTMTFPGTTNGLQTLVDMMSGIRVVFTETNNVGGDVFGIAKVAINQLPMSFAAQNVEVDNSGVEPVYNETGATTLDLALTVVPAGANNTMLWSFGVDAITNNLANATFETVVDTLTSTTYQRVKVLPVVSDGADGYIVDEDAEPTYYHIADQAIEMTGELCMYNFSVNPENGVLTFGEPMEVQSITTLGQNIATKITALVYLDGDYIDNADVVNSEDGISNTGRLNLQFASSANLVPMNNSTLKDGFGVEANIPNAEGWSFVGEEMTAANTDYLFTVAAPTDSTYTVSYSVDGVDKGAPTDQGAGSFKIDAANVTGNIVITVVDTTTP